MLYFHKTTPWIKKLYPSLEWSFNANEPTVYLTFDDGPVPIVTEFVLDLLKEYKAKATFFCVGDNIRKHPHLFKRILSDGHGVGNHTFNHLNGWKTDNKTYLKNIKYCDQVINEQLHELGIQLQQRPLFRPPHGKMATSQRSYLQHHYRIIMWDILTGDFDTSLPPEVCLERAIKYTENGSIITFHDSYKAEKNLRYVLPKYLEFLAKKGFLTGKI